MRDMSIVNIKSRVFEYIFGLRSTLNFGFYFGLFLFTLVLLLPTPAGMNESAQVVAAVALLMATWWISETLPFAVTALIPIVFFPVFGVMGIIDVIPSYVHQIIFLFLSGFIFALCIERWHLHKRIALHTIKLFGFSYHKILLGFMVATAFLSMWVSNTATVLMMIPVALAVASQLEPGSEFEPESSSKISGGFSLVLLLGLAYSASIGGVATLIGTPPNAILAGMLEQQAGITVNFFDWMMFALPLATVFLFVAWLYLNFLMKSILTKSDSTHFEVTGEAVLLEELAKLPSMSKEERSVIIVFSIVCFLWITRGFIDIEIFKNIKDSMIGMVGAIMLFLLPAKNGTQRLMNWKTTKKLPWGILILFGGGFALASGFESSELTSWLALKFTFLQDLNVVLVIFSIVLFVIFLTEITSNTATATLLIPLMIALSQTFGVPAIWLATAVAVATSYAFMLPVATPPNAIVYSTGRVPIQRMVRVGFWLNIIGSVLITLFVVWLLPLIWV